MKTCPGERVAERYVVILEPLPPRRGAAVPVEQRLRMLLKRALRDYSFRALHVGVVGAENDAGEERESLKSADTRGVSCASAARNGRPVAGLEHGPAAGGQSEPDEEIPR